MERHPDRSRLNISEEHKAFLWLPTKTGSLHASIVFSCFSFNWLDCSYNKKEVFDVSDLPFHMHSLDLFEGHENYKLICTARNPIHRIFSAFVFSNRYEKKLEKSEFVKFFSKIMESETYFWDGGLKNTKREPDYFLRVENLYEDYLKIPFVRESKLNLCGALKELCEKKKNESRKFEVKIQDFYTSDMIEHLYFEFKDYFDKLEYKPEL